MNVTIKPLFFLCVLFYVVIFISTEVFAMIKKLRLESHLTKQIETILDTSQLLHQSLIKNDNDQVKIHLSHIKRLIFSTNRASYNSSVNTLHLRHILRNTKRAVERASLHKQESLIRQNIKGLFDQLVLLPKTYRLNSRYPIYFCSKDKSVWLQKAGRIRNPIHSHYTFCGSIVN